MTQLETLELLVNTQSDQIRRQEESNAKLTELIQKQTEQLIVQQQKIDELLAQLAWFNRQYFGCKSEKLAHLDPNQLSLFDFGSSAEQLAGIESERIAAEKEITESVKEKQTKRSNRKFMEDLPVVEVVIEPENIDPNKYKRIGEERTRTLEFEPGKLYVREIIRPKYGLKGSVTLPEDGQSEVLIAPLPLLPIYKGLPGASLLAEILLQKYEYHIPFYRQVRQLRHLGMKISENTLSGWFRPAAELLKPLYEELTKEVLSTDYIQVDETTLPVINKESRQAKKEYLWVVRSVMKKQVFFHYDNGSRSQKTISALLASFKGYLQSDGYQGYNIFEGKEEVCLVSCMAHIRRRYEQALDENKVLAEHALKEIQHLYRIERMAKEQELSDEKRAALRRRLAKPILIALEKWMEKTYPTVLPKSRMGQAIAYSYSIWPRMKTYLDDGRLLIDNNRIENIIRPIALSRKNFLFCGNHQAAENTAVICSLLASCKEADVNPRQWLKDVIGKLPYYLKPKTGKELKELLPNCWKHTNANKI